MHTSAQFPARISPHSLCRTYRHGIGTDATLATHITTVQERGFAERDPQLRFVPTTLGVALVDGLGQCPGAETAARSDHRKTLL